MTFRLFRGLPAYLRRPLTPSEARAIVRRRLERREADFLDLARRAIYGNPASPYLALLRLAGCEFEDLKRLVGKEGVEGALHAIRREGVYLTVDEFKGRRPVVRGGAEFVAGPARLRNPLSVPHLLAMTSGSRGVATRIQLDLASVRDRAVNMSLALQAWGGGGWRNAVWTTRGLVPLLWYSAAGTVAARWFLQIDPGALGPWSEFLWSIRLATWSSRLARVPLPSPEYAPIEDPARILAWMERTLREGAVPHLWVAPSAAVRLCRAAEEAGADIAGARFTVTGEPVTGARLAAIRGVGADALPDYGSADSGGSIGYGCLDPETPDDVHVFRDLNAVIHADDAPFPKDALLVSSLRATTPFVFLNVSMGDRAAISERRCGCPMEALGYVTHMHTIRSFEKLTAGGITFEDTDVIRVLEEVLPRRFGGGPTDYQLVEDAGDDGSPKLELLVHPSVGIVDESAVAETFLGAIGEGPESTRAQASLWRSAGFLRVVREAPRSTGSGKVLHLIAGSSTRHGADRTGRPRAGSPPPGDETNG